MFKINDYIMYGTTGVCKVIDIKEEVDRNYCRRKYYVLNPIYTKNTVIKVPVDNEKIVMRKVHSMNEIFILINSIPNIDTVWIDDDRQRSEKFKLMLKTGKCEDLIILIKSIYEDIKNRKRMRRKLCKTDEEIMKSAEKLLNEEFATILNIIPDEVPKYIISHIPQ